MKLEDVIQRLGELYLSQGNVEVSIDNSSIGSIVAIDNRINIASGADQHGNRVIYSTNIISYKNETAFKL